MKSLAIAIVVILFASCVTEKKASRYMREHPNVLAGICADEFPPNIEYRPGKPILKTDTLIQTDSVIIEVNVDCPDGTVVKADCPPNRTITKTIRDSITIIDTVSVENTARVEQLQYEIAEVKSERSELKLNNQELDKKRGQYLKWSLLFGGIIAVQIGIRLWKFFRVV